MNNKAKETIKIGIIGIGVMGKGILYQSHITPGIDCLAICDINIQRCIDVLIWLKRPYKIVSSIDELDNAISSGFVAVCESGLLLAQSKILQVIVESSTAITNGAEHTILALNNAKHVVLMNSEIDLMFGPLFAQVAQKNGVTCTSSDGDQYGTLKHIIEDIKMWGFELVMAGNIKGYLDLDANPTTIIPEADKRNLDYRQCTSYTDGTKLNIEMAIIANSYNLVTKTPGMFGPRATHVKEVVNLLDFDKLWVDRKPFVDYVLGAEPNGGVFVVGYCDNPYQKDMLTYYKMGNGPYYVFYRHYHICHIEMMHTIFKAARENKPFLTPKYGLKTNVYAYAKRDLHAGETLDGIGGYTCYGKIENSSDNQNLPGIPICLAEDITLNKNIAKNQKILMSDITSANTARTGL